MGRGSVSGARLWKGRSINYFHQAKKLEFSQGQFNEKYRTTEDSTSRSV